MQQGEARYDVTLRYEKPYRDTREAINDIRLLTPGGERVSLAQLTTVSTDDGAEEIYREGGQRSSPSSTLSAAATWDRPSTKPSTR